MSTRSLMGLGFVILGLIAILFGIQASQELTMSILNGNYSNLSQLTVWFSLFGLVLIMCGWFLLVTNSRK